MCSVNLINSGVEVVGDTATVQFAGVGPVSSFDWMETLCLTVSYTHTTYFCVCAIIALLRVYTYCYCSCLQAPVPFSP